MLAGHFGSSGLNIWRMPDWRKMGSYEHLSSVFFIKITLTSGCVVASLYEAMLTQREMSLNII